MTDVNQLIRYYHDKNYQNSVTCLGPVFLPVFDPCTKTCCLPPQAAQAHYMWVKASEVIWSEYTRIISALSDAK